MEGHEFNGCITHRFRKTMTTKATSEIFSPDWPAEAGLERYCRVECIMQFWLIGPSFRCKPLRVWTEVDGSMTEERYRSSQGIAGKGRAWRFGFRHRLEASGH
jgi:hypothetical protein